MPQLFPGRRFGISEWRWLVFTTMSVLLAWLATIDLGLAHAQEPAGKAEAPAAKDMPAAPAKEDNPAPAADAAAPAAAPAAPAGGAGTSPPPPDTLLSLAIQSSGPIGAFLLLLSVYFTALVIRLFMELRISEAVPSALVKHSRPRSARRNSRMLMMPARTTIPSWPDWCGPASPTCRRAAPRQRRR